MRAHEFINPDDDVEESKPSTKTCMSTKHLPWSHECSCRARGLRTRTSKGKGHATGQAPKTGNRKGTGKYVKGTRLKSVHYGGEVKDYSGSGRGTKKS